jgi:hypothetical protein
LNSRVLITLRQPTPGNVELVVSRDGEAMVYPLTLDQIKLLSLQAVRVVCASTVAQGKETPRLQRVRDTTIHILGSRPPAIRLLVSRSETC